MAAAFKIEQARNIIGARVKKARLAHVPSLTQDQLSGKIASEGVQIDRVTIAKIESGLRCVFDYEVKAFASALNVDARWLLGIGESVGKQRSQKGRA
jgi:hypothetical protein